MCRVQCAVFRDTVQSAMYNVRCKSFGVQCTCLVRSKQFSLSIVCDQFETFNFHCVGVQCLVCSVKWTLCNVQCTMFCVHILQFAVCRFQCALCIVQCEVYSMQGAV